MPPPRLPSICISWRRCRCSSADAVLFVFLGAQAAFDVDLAALLQVFPGNLGQTAEKHTGPLGAFCCSPVCVFHDSDVATRIVVIAMPLGV
jgi:hypothetical protein